jgi:iron complex outermembrane receptor protein
MRIRIGLVQDVGRSCGKLSGGENCWIRRCVGFGLLLSMFLTLPAWPQQKPADLLEQSLEDLMNIHVTSVSKADQKMSQVAAAMFVIEQEDIRRSGATNIPDLLRMVPGLDVAQINANTWAISVRGFNSQFANKLLVLVDGRAVYTPTFAEVFWDALDVPLEDIDRIEVIRGPGGAVWGDNAVNGVINIITKKATDTLGTLVTGGGGTAERGFGTIQYGGATKGGTAYRAFADYHNRDHFPDLNGQDGGDGSHLLHGGFRIDSNIFEKDTLTLQGDLYSGGEGESIVHSVLSPPENLSVFRQANLSGGNVLGRWNHAFSSRSDITLQFYFDRYTRSGPQDHETRDTVDFDFRHHLVFGSRHDLNWGVGYRHSADQTIGTIDLAFVPADQSGGLFNFFVEDQITLKPDRLLLFPGMKIENNYFSGFDVEPSIRLAWTPTNRQTFWGAVSGVHRAPSQRDVSLKAALAALPGPSEVILAGNSNFGDEKTVAYDFGYRTQVNKRLSIDLTTFVSDYYSLQSIESLPSFIEPNSSPPLLVIPMTFANKMHGLTAGVEGSVRWKVSDRWTLSPGYSFLTMHLHADATSLDTTSAADTQGSSPGHQAQLRSDWELPHGIGWDASAYFVGSLPAQGVPSYTRLDSQLTWQFSERAQLSIVGQNLLSDHRLEFNSGLAAVNPSQVKRSIFGRVVWHF